MRYLKKAWYCGALSSEIGDQPSVKTLFGQPVLLYRTRDGSAVALSDICPHRRAPLHRGKIEGDDVECPYHGLRFAPDGQCVHNPHGSGAIPPTARLQSYPLAERHGVAWIWGGRSEDADHALIPALPELEPEQKRTVVFGSLHVRANYELVVDNLMDLTHAGYLHGESVSVGAGVAQPRISSRVKDGVVFSSFLTANVTPPRPFLPFWKDGAPCDYHRICSWQAPSIVKTSIGISEPGKGLETGIWFDGYHLLTPETDLTCHYSWSNARTYALADAAYDEALKALVKRAFVEEDEPMIAACQANMSGETDLYALSPALIETDKPCVLVHHKLMSLIAKEEVAAS